MVLVLLYAEVRAIPSGNAQYLVHRKEGAESLIACFSSHKGRSSVHRKEGRSIHSSIDSLATGWILFLAHQALLEKEVGFSHLVPSIMVYRYSFATEEACHDYTFFAPAIAAVSGINVISFSWPLSGLSSTLHPIGLEGMGLILSRLLFKHIES